jgi:plasmid stability protein
MPDLLIRNIPPVLHARLKAAAAAHRRSLTQEAIQIIEEGLETSVQRAVPRLLPEPIKLRTPTTVAETQRFIDDDITARGY